MFEAAIGPSGADITLSTRNRNEPLQLPPPNPPQPRTSNSLTSMGLGLDVVYRTLTLKVAPKKKDA